MIYTYPDGVVDNLQVKGAAVFDGSTYVTGEFQAATGVHFDASVDIGSADTDDLGFYGVGGATQWTTIDDASDATVSMIGGTENIGSLQEIVDALKGVGLCATA